MYELLFKNSLFSLAFEFSLEDMSHLIAGFLALCCFFLQFFREIYKFWPPFVELDGFQDEISRENVSHIERWLHRPLRHPSSKPSLQQRWPRRPAQNNGALEHLSRADDGWELGSEDATFIEHRALWKKPIWLRKPQRNANARFEKRQHLPEWEQHSGGDVERASKRAPEHRNEDEAKQRKEAEPGRRSKSLQGESFPRTPTANCKFRQQKERVRLAIL